MRDIDAAAGPEQEHLPILASCSCSGPASVTFRSMRNDIEVYFNSRCSKCRTLVKLLTERGLEVGYRHYLDSPLSREEIEVLLEKLGLVDPAQIVRKEEAVYTELGLASATRAGLMNALARHPILLERPIVCRNGKAVIARPPELAFALLESD